MAENILAEAPKKSVILADGKEYILSSVNLNILAGLEEEFGCSLTELRAKSDAQSMSVFRSLLFVFLRENYPTITKEKVGKLVSLEIMPEVSKAMAELWGRP